MVRFRRIAAILALPLVLAACAGPDDPTPSATVPTALPPSSTSPSVTAAASPADPYAIPAVIDAAYVNRVLAALYKLDGDVTRRILATREIDSDTVRMLDDIYGDPQLTLEVEGLQSVLTDDPAIYQAPPGDRRVTVSTVVAVGRGCIVAQGEYDAQAVLRTTTTLSSDELFIVVLKAADGRASATPRNPTPWVIVGARIVPVDQFEGAATPCE